MLGSLTLAGIAFVVGVFVGWYIPQPLWAVKFIDWLKRQLSNINDPNKKGKA